MNATQIASEQVKVASVFSIEFISLSNSIGYFTLPNGNVAGYIGFNNHKMLIQFANFLRSEGYDRLEIRRAKRLNTRYEIKISGCTADFMQLIFDKGFNLELIKDSLYNLVAEKLNEFVADVSNVVTKISSEISAKISNDFDFNKHSQSFDFSCEAWG